MRNTKNTDGLDELKLKLQQVRQESLAAVRRNDFRAVARLTGEAARLNRAIHAGEEFSDCLPAAQRLIDSLADIDSPGHFVFPQVSADEPLPEVCQDAA